MCYNPLVRVDYDGKITIYTLKEYQKKIKSLFPDADVTKPYFYDNESAHVKTNVIPCGHCIECKQQRASDWSVRVFYESKKYIHNCFLTLTFDDRKIDPGREQNRVLYKKDIQLFIKRLRQYLVRHVDKNLKIKYFLAGEYGSRTHRPHYHICLLGYGFENCHLYKVNKSKSGYDMFTCPELESLWKYGFCYIQKLTAETCSYAAGYCLKKLSPKAQMFEDAMILKEQENRREYENYIYKNVKDKKKVEILCKDYTPQYQRTFCTMSRRPGLGLLTFLKSCKEILNRGFINIGKVKKRIPRYFRQKLEKLFPVDYKIFIDNLKSKLDFSKIYDLIYLSNRREIAYNKYSFCVGDI